MRVIVFSQRRFAYLALFIAVAVAVSYVHLGRARETARIISGLTVVIDPGHGGKDMGATGPGGTEEKHVVLAVSLRIREMLESEGVNVFMTRETDTDLAGMGDGPRKPRDLARRVEIATEQSADLFLSIHANAVPSPVWSGAQVFYDAEKNQLNRLLAESIQHEFKRLVGGTRREASSRIDNYILRNLDIPAVTIEIGFLSNPREETLLAQREHQDKIAWAICAGVMRFLVEAGKN